MKLLTKPKPLLQTPTFSDSPNSTTVIDRPQSRTKEKTKKPQMYQVILHNDDFTPRDFVVHVLEKFFRKSENQAVAIMLSAHKSGAAQVSIYTREIAETKVHQANQFSQQSQLPLKFSFEPTT